MQGGLRQLGKSCEQCEKLADPDNFPKGVAVKIPGVYDCENCIVMEYQPIPENQNVIDLYNALPQNYEGYSGLRQISATDIKFVLELFDVDKGLWDDYYQKIMYFHSELMKASLEVRKKKQKEEEAKRKWKKRRQKAHRTH